MQPVRHPGTQLLMRVVAHRDNQVIGSQHGIKMRRVYSLERQAVPTGHRHRRG